jgi:hypothetical protein
MDPDGLVAPPLAGLPIGGDKQSRSLPMGSPLDLGESAGGITSVDGLAKLGRPAATPAHRHPTVSDLLLDLGQSGLQVLQPPLLFEPL